MLCLEESSNVTLHVADMTLDNDTISLVDVETQNPITIKEHAYDPKREFYIAHLSQRMSPGRKYKISIKYVANLNDNLKGFYRSVYKDLSTGNDE